MKVSHDFVFRKWYPFKVGRKKDPKSSARTAPVLSRDTAIKCLKLLLKPFARWSLKHSIRLQDLTDCLKEAMLEEAKLSFPEANTMSRLSLLTGIHRKDLRRFEVEATPVTRATSLSVRVLGQWQGDKRFLTTRGKARVLEIDEFHDLVKSVSSDVSPATVLFELERSGTVSRNGNLLQLAQETFVTSGEVEESFQHLQGDITDLLEVVEHNSISNSKDPHHHLRTEYDRVRADAIPDIRDWLAREGRDLHKRAREFLSTFDQDVNPKSSSNQDEVRVVIGSFSMIAEKDKK